MKSLSITATLVFAFAVFANAKPHKLLPPHKQAAVDACMKKLGITEQQLHEYHEHKVSAEVAKSRDCFFACIGKELGVMNADGNIDREMALKDLLHLVPEENRTKIVDTCLEQKGADDCETFKLFHTCINKFVLGPLSQLEYTKTLDGCRNKLNMTDEEVKKIIDSSDELQSDCFSACLAKDMGFLNEDGTFNKEAYVSISPWSHKKTAQKIADECTTKVGADACESISLFNKCSKRFEAEAMKEELVNLDH